MQIVDSRSWIPKKEKKNIPIYYVNIQTPFDIFLLSIKLKISLSKNFLKSKNKQCRKFDLLT